MRTDMHTSTDDRLPPGPQAHAAYLQGEDRRTLQYLPIERIRTNYEMLRPGKPRLHPDQVALLPLRVVPCDDDHYEVIDGFKRLSRWQEAGHRFVPALLETPGTAIDDKRRILMANAPPRTLTPLDEARVVCSLIDDDRMTVSAVAAFLRRKKKWVTCRHALGKKLSPIAQEAVARGRIGVSFAQALTALADDDQDKVLEAVNRKGLSANEAIALVQTYRIADDIDRRALLRDPLGTLQPPLKPSVSPRAAEIERHLENIRTSLRDLRTFVIPPDLSPPESRRLDAVYRSVLLELEETATAVIGTPPSPEQEVPLGSDPDQEGDNQNRSQRKKSGKEANEGFARGPQRDHSASTAGLRHSENRGPNGPWAKGHPPDPTPRGLQRHLAPECAIQQAGAVP